MRASPREDMDRGVYVFVGCAVAVAVASFVPTGTAPGSLQKTHAVYNGVWHAGTYAALAVVGFYAFDRDRWLVVAAGVVVLGAVVEAGQAFITYRTATVADVLANTAGVVVAFAVAEARRLTV